MEPPQPCCTVNTPNILALFRCTYLISGYGGFSISVAPAFNSSNLTFLKNYGAVFVVANIRGGAEYGEEWHQAGIRERKVKRTKHDQASLLI
jgi:prolyl oligopeptidase PreP (S9A serine peptidase family)